MSQNLGATFLAVVLTGMLASCTLRPDQREQSGPQQRSIKKVADVGNSPLIGKVKVDEFNDQATGKDVPADGGQIVTIPNAEPASLNAFVDNSAATQEISSSYIFNQLLRRDPETFQWEGSLAERWTEEDVLVKKDGTKLRGVVSEPKGTNSDVIIKTSSGEETVARQSVQEIRKGVVFTFHLRRGVRFHDGVPLTAADVKFTFDTIKDEYVDDPSIRNYFKDLETCEILDNFTVRFTYSKQYWQAREVVGSFDVYPKHIYDADNLLEKDPQAYGKRFNESPENRKPIGTGPYEFERWDTGSQIVLKKNPNYWDIPRRGHLDRIVFKIISDLVAALQALKNGEVNFLPSISAELFEKETNNPEFLRRFAKSEYYTGGYAYVGWNMRRPPFNDQKVRQAMAYGALDKQEFLEQVRYGHGVLVTGSQYFFGPAYDHSILPQPFDPDNARQLLLEAGWYDRDGDGLRDKNGMAFRFEVLQPSGSAAGQRLAALMKENLRKLGIDMTVRQLEWATFLQNVYDRKFDAIFLGWGGTLEEDPYQVWHTSQGENRGSNHVGFGNDETDRLIEESRITLDDTARRKLFFQLHRLQHETQPYLFLYMPSNLGVYDKRYRGVKFYKASPGYDLSEWYLAEAAQNGLKARNQ